MPTVILISTVVGVSLGMFFVYRKQAQRVSEWGAKITQALSESESLALPELVTKLGLEDGFMSRGKVMAVINPMVGRGELLQEEPPGTTISSRLQVLRFRLNRGRSTQS